MYRILNTIYGDLFPKYKYMLKLENSLEQPLDLYEEENIWNNDNKTSKSTLYKGN